MVGVVKILEKVIWGSFEKSGRGVKILEKVVGVKISSPLHVFKWNSPKRKKR